MTKPSDFIMNSDFLSIAQTESKELTAVFAAETIQPGQPYNRNSDFTVGASPSAVDMFLISRNGGDYLLGSHLTISANQPFLSIRVYRLNATTIRVSLHGYTSQTGGYSMPMQTIKVKISSFKPPNVF